jgi:hypothetical protein
MMLAHRDDEGADEDDAAAAEVGNNDNVDVDVDGDDDDGGSMFDASIDSSAAFASLPLLPPPAAASVCESSWSPSRAPEANKALSASTKLCAIVIRFDMPAALSMRGFALPPLSDAAGADPVPPQLGQTGVDIDGGGGIGIRPAGVIDAHRFIGLEVSVKIFRRRKADRAEGYPDVGMPLPGNVNARAVGEGQAGGGTGWRGIGDHGDGTGEGARSQDGLRSLRRNDPDQVRRVIRRSRGETLSLATPLLGMRLVRVRRGGKEKRRRRTCGVCL